MAKLTFYKQVRVDGGVRIGIDSDSEELLQWFKEGSEDTDPTLLWFADIRCEGNCLPGDAEGARNWFARHRTFFVSALRKAASEELRAGFDTELMPVRCKFSSGPDDSQVELLVAALRRLDGREIGGKLTQIADSWDSMLECLLLPSIV